MLHQSANTQTSLLQSAELHSRGSQRERERESQPGARLERVKRNIPRLRNSGGTCNSLLLIVSTNLFAISDSRCRSGKLDSEALDGAVVALSLRTYKFLSSPPGAAFFGVLPIATTAISGVPIRCVPVRLHALNFFLFLSYPTLLACRRNEPA